MAWDPTGGKDLSVWEPGKLEYNSCSVGWSDFIFLNRQKTALNPNQSGMPADSKGVACWYFTTKRKI